MLAPVDFLKQMANELRAESFCKGVLYRRQKDKKVSVPLYLALVAMPACVHTSLLFEDTQVL